jgi:hypothetical protein
MEADDARPKGVTINLAQLVAEQRRLVARAHTHTHIHTHTHTHTHTSRTHAHIRIVEPIRRAPPSSRELELKDGDMGACRGLQEHNFEVQALTHADHYCQGLGNVGETAKLLSRTPCSMQRHFRETVERVLAAASRTPGTIVDIPMMMIIGFYS